MKLVMDHIVLNVTDEDKMIAFYQRVLELPVERLDLYREGKAPFPSLRVNEETIIDLFPKSLWASGNAPVTSGRTNLNHFCLALSRTDWEQLCKRLEISGVSITEGPVERWGARGVGISIYFRDPENNLVEARYYKADSAE